jgi:HK97 family phage major capsid protein
VEASTSGARLAVLRGFPLVAGKYPPIAGGAQLVTIEEHEARVDEIKSRLQELNQDHAGRIMPDIAATEWNRLNEELVTERETITELRHRKQRLAEINNEDVGVDSERAENGAGFHTSAGRAMDNIWDLTAIRAIARDPDAETRLLRENAVRSVDQATFPHENAHRETIQAHLVRLMERFEAMDEEETNVGLGGGNVNRFARHMLATGAPVYRRAFRKGIRGRPLTTEEQRALSLTGASGGFAVPYQLDPTIIPTSNSSVNPYRAISRVESVTVDEWRGVASAGVVAAYAAEATEATDNSPVLSQPTISTERAQAFIPYSFEIGQDWGSLETEMATLIQDAKDDLEAAKFTAGTGANEPFGLITGATTLVTAGGTASYAVADVYSVENALGPRFRTRAQWVGNRSIYNRTRQFDTAGGASLWVDNLRQGLPNNVPTPGNLGSTLIGYPANEVSAMDAGITTASKILVLGDFRYFIIVDRIGMSISNIPHLFGTNRMPTGQSGLYAFWRNSSKVVDANAFRVLRTG